jgi:pimeloyl-ACP methyl ester carboxylesterase
MVEMASVSAGEHGSSAAHKLERRSLSLVTPVHIAGALAVAPGLLLPVWAQVKTDVPPVVPGAKPVTVERIKVNGAALQGNLEGNAVDRTVLVFLPPSYAKQKSRRYPVEYALHGYSIGAEQWAQEIHVPQTVEGAFAEGVQDMIVVLPDSKTVHNGSMYSSSVTTGDFELFIARDLVAWIDSHYRTIAKRSSRGLAGHSMGGYGATRIGMKHADVFGSVYIMSPCCLAPRGAGPVNPAIEKALASVKTPADSASLSFGPRAQLASAAAWSPNPKNPPLYLDLPMKDGVPQPHVLAKWAANAPLAFADQYVSNLRRYRGLRLMWAIRTDCGLGPPGCTKCWKATESPIRTRSIAALIPARLPSGFRTTSCRSSAGICAPERLACKYDRLGLPFRSLVNCDATAAATRRQAGFLSIRTPAPWPTRICNSVGPSLDLEPASNLSR